MVVNVIYRTSTGVQYPLQIAPLRIKAANFHEWEYTPNVLGRRFGDWVLRFDKAAAVYETELYASGPKTTRRDYLDTLHKAFEHDIRSVKTGRIVYGNSYIECYIVASSTYPVDDTYTANDIKIYCPWPFWIEPQSYEFIASETGGAIVGEAIVGSAIIGGGSSESGEFLDYPHDYEYDYTALNAGYQTIVNDSPAPAAFKMVIYGPCQNPYFYVGNALYQVYTTVGAGEYLTIDSRAKTVLRTTVNGTNVNEFNNRRKESSIFEAIPEGTSRVIWPATFGMTLTLLKERSEPIWT